MKRIRLTPRNRALEGRGVEGCWGSYQARPSLVPRVADPWAAGEVVHILAGCLSDGGREAGPERVQEVWYTGEERVRVCSRRRSISRRR
jgi:hypothetical protein